MDMNNERILGSSWIFVHSKQSCQEIKLSITVQAGVSVLCHLFNLVSLKKHTTCRLKAIGVKGHRFGFSVVLVELLK